MPQRLDDYRLEDRYVRERGRVFLTGTQALVRMALLQQAADRAEGLNTAGFISGYRGSPLAGFDLSLWQARDALAENAIHFLPAVNEELAATACLGTQQLEGEGRNRVDGVFSIWYGKGPGVDRAGDALKHGNHYGSSPHGGVLAIAGDDHGCVSSSFSHQSDEALIAFSMPVSHPAKIGEYLDFGLFGWALSRFSGCWVGMKAISETVEGAAAVELPPLPAFTRPEIELPSGGLNNRWPDMPSPEIEKRLAYKLAAVRAFAAANPIDRHVFGAARPRLGIVTVGKAHLDLMDLLDVLGIDAQAAEEQGIGVYKVGLVWPLEREGLMRFAERAEELLVVEEKHGVVERQVKETLFNLPAEARPRVSGKTDPSGAPLLAEYEEMRPHRIAGGVAARIAAVCSLDPRERAARIGALPNEVVPPDWVQRKPYFCAGCPHNSSTRVPEGSHAYAGIGCHFMASWMERETSNLTQMGGEGVNWTGLAPFTDTPHVFQNLGDGTYYHSGSLAIRQAVAAKANITYKILFNDAVAMTGGQPVDGPVSVGEIVRELEAMAVKRIEVVGDETDALNKVLDLPGRYHVRHRDEMDAIQRELREIKGVTAIVYVQTCAAEKRRRRKKGQYPDPERRVFINEAVCEGCGDCSKQSNCVAVIPKETAWGTKRQIDQDACNKDFSCIKGFCPSFVEVEGGTIRKQGAGPDAAEIERLLGEVAAPEIPALERSHQLLVTGVGGTGVVTVGALVTMAAHLEGKGATVLDFTGFAQKGGEVMSHIKVAPAPEDRPVRIDRGRVDGMIACDTVVATNAEMLGTIRPGHTRIVANAAETATGQFVLDRDAKVRGDLLIQRLQRAAGADRVSVLDAREMARKLCGDSIATNILLLGYAWQAGLVPVSEAALMRAIELNGVAIAANKRAFALGRLAAAKREALAPYLEAEAEGDRLPQTLDGLIAHRSRFLERYQSPAYARAYREFVEGVARAEAALGGDGRPLTGAVARNLAKLMAYKDEYEVARLYSETAVEARLKGRFEGRPKLAVWLAPPVLNFGKDSQGRPKKRRFGPWIFPLFGLLAKGRRLRGTPVDPFGWMAERRIERALIGEYRALVAALLDGLTAENRHEAAAIAELADGIRGFGPVKMAAIDKYRAEITHRLDAFRDATGTARTPTTRRTTRGKAA